MLPENAIRDQIDRRNKVPLYQQLYELLQAKIKNKEWEPGDILPSEHDLLDSYQVSRATVRQALDALVNDGLIYREQGRGTFVAYPNVDQTLVRIVSFTEDMERRGFKPSTKVLFFGKIKATPKLASQLAIQPGDELMRLDRLRLADGEPMSIEESFLVHSMCSGLSDYDFSENSLRVLLEEVCNIQLLQADQIIRAISAPSNIARPLTVKTTDPLLYIERVSYSQYNLPVEFLRLYHRGDRYELFNSLRG